MTRAAQTRWFGLAGILLLCLLTSACHQQCPSVGADTDIVLIDMTGCRPDRMSLYGYQRPTTPTLDRLAEEPSAVLFRNHHVASVSTGPSTASLMTGLLPSQLGFFGELAAPDQGSKNSLDAKLPTLAETLRARGFQTAGIVSSQHLTSESGFSRGFDHFFLPAALSTDQQRTAKAIEMLTSGRQRGQPVFLYLQLEACTDPYPADRRDQSYLRAHKIKYGESRRRMRGIDFQNPRFRDALAAGRVTTSAADRAFLNLIYEAKLYYYDRHILDPFFQHLREAKHFDQAMFVITSSHGQELFDREQYGYGHALWNELTAAPLLIKFPRLRRPPDLESAIEQITGTIDLYPTIACAVGAESSSELLGRQIILGEHRDWALTETPTGRKLVTSDHALLIDSTDQTLYDRAADPRELTDVSSAQGDRARELAELLASLGTPRPAVGE